MTLSAVIGPVAAAVGATIGVLGYRRATRVDKAVEKSAVIEAQTGQSGQVIAGMNLIIEAQRADARDQRQAMAEMRVIVREMTADFAAVVKERDQLRIDLTECRELARQARRDPS